METIGSGRNNLLHKQGCKTGEEKETTDKKSGNNSDLVQQLKEETEPFYTEHQFNKDWQNNQEKVLEESPQMSWASSISQKTSNVKINGKCRVHTITLLFA